MHGAVRLFSAQDKSSAALKPEKRAEVKAKPSTEKLLCQKSALILQSDADTAKRQEGCGCSSSAISIKPT